MPKIEAYTQQTRATTSLPGPIDFDSGRGAAELGQALESVADDQARLKAFARQKSEERDAVAANERLMGLKGRWAEELPKRQREAPEGAEGFTLGVLKDFDTEAEESIKQTSTEPGRNHLKARLSEYRLALQKDALGFEAMKGVELKVTGLQRSVDAARTAAEFRPQDFGTLAAEQRAAIEASGLPADAQRELLHGAVTNIAGAAVEGAIRRDPYAALKSLNDEKSQELAVRALSFDQRQTLRNRAEAEIRQREAQVKSRQVEARQALADEQRDIMAAAELGLPITDPPSRKEFTVAFGEREGTQRYEAVQLASRLAGNVAELNQLPTAALVKRAETFKPTDVEGAGDKAPMYAFLSRSVAGILTAREEDPAGYLTQYSPTVKSAWAELQTAEGEEQPEAAAAYLRTVNAERERLGIVSTELLPKTYAEGVVARLTQPQASQNLAATMTAEAERWGPAWPLVYRQVQKDLPETALVIGAGIPQRAALALATVTTLKDDQIKSQVLTSGTTWKDLEEAVDDHLEDMGRTFGPEGAPTLTAIRSSAQKLTAAYMAQGSSLADAAEQATRDLANDKYTFATFRAHTYRVPVDFDVDADLVDDGATVALGRFNAMTGTVPKVPGQPEEILLGQATEVIRNRGYWVTAPDESGLRLYHNGQPVPGAGGRPVQYSWDELRAFGAARESEIRAARERYERDRREGAPGVP